MINNPTTHVLITLLKSYNSSRNEKSLAYNLYLQFLLLYNKDICSL